MKISSTYKSSNPSYVGSFNSEEKQQIQDIINMVNNLNNEIRQCGYETKQPKVVEIKRKGYSHIFVE
jgi:hypothetical protein